MSSSAVANKETVSSKLSLLNEESGGKDSGEKVIELVLKKGRARSALSEEERAELIVDYRLKARKLARSILRKWQARMDLEEVDSIVDLSLCEAAERYNPKKGASFITFMYYHLRGNLIRAVKAAANAHTIPVEEPNAYDGQERQSIYRGASAIEIAEALCSHEHILPEEMLMRRELVELSRDACGRLDSLEREVIERIYLHEQQLMDIAHSLGYSRCHISRVKKKALEALYEDLARALQLEESARPNSSAEESPRTLGNRRKIHRRRPRAKLVKRSIEPTFAQAVHQ